MACLTSDFIFMSLHHDFNSQFTYQSNSLQAYGLSNSNIK
ncbi:hypothetical protein BOVA713_91 [Bacteroides ovatus]|nr:hypothetical protein BOVA713_91 [Bacteroides ovatus]